MISSTRNALRLMALLAFAAILLSLNLGGYSLWPADEPRFAQVAREMLQSGDYLAPHMNGEPYSEKPPLVFWAVAAISAPFGDVTEITARIPSVVSALIVLLFTYLVAARMYGPPLARWALVILLTTMRFWWEAQRGTLDMPLTACMAAAFYALWRWHDLRQTRWLLVFYIAIAAGVLVKGPPAIAFPLLCIIVFYWKSPTDRHSLHWIWGLIMVGAIAALWLVPARMAISGETGSTAGEAVSADLFRQIIGRAVMGVSKAQWPWYYLLNTPVDWLPWALFLPWLIPYVWRHRKEDDRARFLWAWIWPAFIFFSAIVGKRAIYLLPIFPAIAIFAARGVLELMADPTRAAWRKRTGYVFAGLFLALSIPCFGLLLLKAFPVLCFDLLHLKEGAAIWDKRLLVVGVCALISAAVMLHQSIRTDMRHLHRFLGGTMTCLLITVQLFAFPVMDKAKSARDFCAPIAQLADEGKSFRLYSAAFSREEYVYYSRHFHEAVLVDWPTPSLPAGVSGRDMAKTLKNLLGEIRGAAADAPVADIQNITPTEGAALNQAVLSVLTKAKEANPILEAVIESQIRGEVESFLDALDQPGPAFAYIQEFDYRWLSGMSERLQGFTVIHGDGVGRRDVLLLANQEGADLLAKD